MEWVGLALFALIIFLTVKYWYIVLPAIAVGIIAYLMYKLNKREQQKHEQAEQHARYLVQERERERAATRDAAERMRQAALRAEQSKLEEQAQLRGALAKLEGTAVGTAKSMVLAARESEDALARATEEFVEHRYSPFWQAVEHTLAHLGAYDAGIRELQKLTRDYAQTEKRLSVPPKKSGWMMPAAPDVAPVLGRLHALVRRAHADANYGMIYEQRRTTATIVRGFQSLEGAIHGMSDRIASSIEAMSDTVTSSVLTMNDSMQDRLSELNNSAELIREEAHAQSDRESRERKRYESEVTQMLDNIQRRRKPYGRY